MASIAAGVWKLSCSVRVAVTTTVCTASAASAAGALPASVSAMLAVMNLLLMSSMIIVRKGERAPPRAIHDFHELLTDVVADYCRRRAVNDTRYPTVKFR